MMKGVKIIKFTKNLLVQNFPIPSATSDEVLIKVLYAAMNPSDIYFSKGSSSIEIY